MATGSAEDVVTEGSEEVLAHIAHGGAADLDGRDDALQAAFDEGHVARLDGHVGAGADGEADVGLGQGRGIVDAVADHADGLALELQLLHFMGLAVGQHFGEHALDADLARDGLGRALVVARQHDDLDAQAFQGLDGGLGIRASRYRQPRQGRPALPSIATYIGVLPSPASRSQSLAKASIGDVAVAHQLGIAEQNVVALDLPLTPCPGMAAKPLRIGER